jgi:hypothetical protein
MPGNVRGALDMGLAPGLLPGRVSLDDGRAWFEHHWGALPAGRGLGTAGMLQAASEGRLHALVLLGANPLADLTLAVAPDARIFRWGYVYGSGLLLVEGTRARVLVQSADGSTLETMSDVTLPGGNDAVVVRRSQDAMTFDGVTDLVARDPTSTLRAWNVATGTEELPLAGFGGASAVFQSSIDGRDLVLQRTSAFLDDAPWEVPGGIVTNASWQLASTAAPTDLASLGSILGVLPLGNEAILLGTNGLSVAIGPTVVPLHGAAFVGGTELFGGAIRFVRVSEWGALVVVDDPHGGSNVFQLTTLGSTPAATCSAHWWTRL